MAGTYQLLVDGTAVDDDLAASFTSVEVEENVDLPGAIQLSLPINRTDDGDLAVTNDARFRPFANLALVASAGDGATQCLFDGYVLSHKVHVERGAAASSLQVWGQDAEWLMNLEEKTREWVDVTDADVAASIFGDYGISPADQNSDDDSPTHTEDGHTLMQRGSDIRFLRRLARSNGKICRIACADTPGQYTGWFAKPQLDGDPVLTLSLADPTEWTVDALDVEWEATQPTTVKAAQALFDDDTPEGAQSEVSESGLTLLDERSGADFAGRPITVLLTTPVDDAQELEMRASAVLREAGWLVRCEGQADAARLNAIVRAGTVVMVEGIGTLHSGKYFVWSVRHTFTGDAHTMRFELVRNAVGAEAGGGGAAGLLAGLL